MNRRTREFRRMFALLPPVVQAMAHARFRDFRDDPFGASLHNHPLIDGGRGQHLPGSRSVWLNQRYRAIYRVDRGVNVWYWVGSHSAYNIFTGRN